MSVYLALPNENTTTMCMRLLIAKAKYTAEEIQTNKASEDKTTNKVVLLGK